jgi:superfamily II DNA or RNA helicase
LTTSVSFRLSDDILICVLEITLEVWFATDCLLGAPATEDHRFENQDESIDEVRVYPTYVTAEEFKFEITRPGMLADPILSDATGQFHFGVLGSPDNVHHHAMTYRLLIADECHRNGSARNKDALDERFSRRLGLSTTYVCNDGGNADFLDPYFGGVCYRLGYERALRNRVIAHFSAALIGVRFSAAERNEYDEYSQESHRLRTDLVRKHGVTEEPFGKFMKEVQELSEGGHERATMAARLFLSVFTKRRRLLAETPAKAGGLRKLVDAIRSANRTLVFTQTIEGCRAAALELEGANISAGMVHSGMRPEDRRAVLERFTGGFLQVVVAPQVLDEGVDVPEADLAVILAASKTRRQMI